MSAFIIGSTGLVGNFILKHATSYYPNVVSISRSQPKNTEDGKIEVILDKDSSNWASHIPESENNDVFFSALGTTKAAAGGIENQYKIDHDLNLAIATRAKEAGFKKFVLVSSIGASKDSYFPYLKLKGELEEDIKGLNFQQFIILRPGLLIGERKDSKGFLADIAESVGKLVHGTPFSKLALKPVYGEEVALAALKLSKSDSKESVVTIEGLDINKLAKA